MILVFQDRPGTCFAACVATLLNVELREVPQFYDPASYGHGPLSPGVVHDIAEWFGARGLSYAEFAMPLDRDEILAMMETANPGVTYILSGRAASGQAHAVIAGKGRIIHDPATHYPAQAVPQPCRDQYYRVGIIGLAF